MLIVNGSAVRGAATAYSSPGATQTPTALNHVTVITFSAAPYIHIHRHIARYQRGTSILFLFVCVSSGPTLTGTSQANADLLPDLPRGSCEPLSPRNTRPEYFLVRGMPLGTAPSAAPDSTQAGEYVFEYGATDDHRRSRD